ncbi:MAG: hypothetical protein IPK07_01880 [Deltaproteobacteria bacterium]|nr:hypothetical protein [Deltaproteobacteria bacterium]
MLTTRERDRAEHRTGEPQGADLRPRRRLVARAALDGETWKKWYFHAPGST